jgi:hypothetical protein
MAEKGQRPYQELATGEFEWLQLQETEQKRGSLGFTHTRTCAGSNKVSTTKGVCVCL